MRERSEPDRPEDDRVTVVLWGQAQLRVDALAFELWEERGCSTKAPSRSEALRVFIVDSGRAAKVTVRPHVCVRCGRVFGAPWCREHGKRHMKPAPNSDGIST